MSYTIEYNRVFLKSKHGYTALWLHGDNNVYENIAFSKRERRYRSWGIMSDFLGVSEEYMVKKFESWFNDYDEHWMRNGKYLTNKQTVNWVKSGCRNAVTVEELLEVNRFLTITMYVWDYDNQYKQALKQKITTTKELDDWIDAFRKFSTQHKEDKIDFYPHVRFSPEDIRKPQRQISDVQDGKFYVKYRDSYIKEIEDNTSSIYYTRSRYEAKQYTYDEAVALVKKWNNARVNMKLVKVTDDPYNIVIKVHYNGLTKYLQKRVKGKTYVTDFKDSAHRFKNRKEAEKFMERNASLFKFTMEIEEI